MTTPRILVVDDEPQMLEVYRDALSDLPVEVETEAVSGKAAKRMGEGWDLLLVDLKMPAPDGMELLEIAKRVSPDTTAVVLTAFPTIESAVRCIRAGAYDYLAKPFTADQLVELVRRALDHRRVLCENASLSRHLEQSYKFDDLLSRSPRMIEVFDTIDRVAPTDSEILILGESGTGKELVARSIHRRSTRRAQRFVPIDCGAIPESLLESELFGHEKGAFTGAHASTMGLVEIAHRGTLFLDEIGEIYPSLQAKLLRLLQERRFRRVGGREEIVSDIRIVAATNRDLDAEVREGRFRQDLFYRINVVRIGLPPLRDRREDVSLLAEHFLRRFAREWGRDVRGIDPAALEVLQAHAWPGNVRELQNVVKRAVALGRGTMLSAEDLPESVLVSPANGALGGLVSRCAERMSAFERDELAAALKRHAGDSAPAMKELKLPKSTFYRLLKKHDLRPEEFR